MSGATLNPPRGVRGGHDANHAYHGHVKLDGSEVAAPNGVMLELALGEYLRSLDNGGSIPGRSANGKGAGLVPIVVLKSRRTVSASGSPPLRSFGNTIPYCIMPAR